MLTQLVGFAWRRRRISVDAPLRLVSRSVRRPEAAPEPPAEPSPAAPDALSALSLQSGPNTVASLDVLLHPTPTVNEPEAMDVEAPSTFSLGPQRFGGATSSGLEELFGRAMQLETPAPAWRSRSWDTYNVPLLVLVVAGVAWIWLT